ncbi:hypothetical protein XENOCAPTIV_025643 [Xenoophorus captivus]|uniref:Protein C10 n=1 Tax=Xenoophorus captivus TaxID=1517983 RepID=A0ABV0S3J2_9TELE
MKLLNDNYVLLRDTPLTKPVSKQTIFPEYCLATSPYNPAGQMTEGQQLSRFGVFISAPAQQPTLTVEQTRVVLSEVIQAFSVPENAARMEEARESACNDMGKMLQLVLPVATQIQQEVIKAYGFNNEGEEGELFWMDVVTESATSLTGVLKFARLVKMYETQDPEIAAMSAKLKSLLLPQLSTPPIGGTIPAS